MRVIEDKDRRIKGDEKYRRPGGPAPADKVSPLRGLKQRWTGDAGITFARTRAEAIRIRVTSDYQGAQRVFI